MILSIEEPTSPALTRSLDDDDLPLEYKVLHADDQRTVIQYEITTLPRHITQSSAPGNLIQFPLPIRDGWAIADLTTSPERLSRLKDAFETAEIIYNIDIITQSTDATDLLTDRQREFILKAVERGYYESPRRCTLNWIRDDLFTGYLA